MLKRLLSKLKKVLIKLFLDLIFVERIKIGISLFQIYPDPESEKAIMGSVVYCIHHKEGCQWSDELRKLKVRLRTINICLDKVKCSNGGDQSIIFVCAHVMSDTFLYLYCLSVYSVVTLVT